MDLGGECAAILLSDTLALWRIRQASSKLVGADGSCELAQKKHLACCNAETIPLTLSLA